MLAEKITEILPNGKTFKIEALGAKFTNAILLDKNCSNFFCELQNHYVIKTKDIVEAIQLSILKVRLCSWNFYIQTRGNLERIDFNSKLIVLTLHFLFFN